jgi:sulfoxide reductase heme-binding subunit YedZ
VPTLRARRLISIAVFVTCCIPLALIGADALRGRLGANPIATILNRLGFWTLVWLVASLVPTPLKLLFGWSEPIRVRRMLGLFAFFYAFLHFSTYVGVDQFFDLPAILIDIVKRKFITIGFLAFVLLVPLALTSNDRALRRLGFVRWKRLHRLAYVAAICGVIHFIWRVKADLLQPLLFAGVLTVLFAVRLVGWRRQILARRVDRSVRAVTS